MFKELIGLLVIMLAQGFAGLMPMPLITEPHPIQRFNWSEAYEHLRGNLFDQCWGISKAKIRNQPLETWLIAITDDVWDRIVFFKGVDSVGHRYAHWIKKYGKTGSGVGEFQHPRGIAIDTSIYTNQPENYFLYIADRTTIALFGSSIMPCKRVFIFMMPILGLGYLIILKMLSASQSMAQVPILS
uniref:Uncharacterized protein n=1 Tax=candidate division WOR-3 bacterium TaxID=2052148 RepID=A0A7V0Z5J5_UNCW3